MAKKNRGKSSKKNISLGTLAGFAGVFLLFVSSINQSLAMTLVIVALLGYSAYKFLFSKDK